MPIRNYHIQKKQPANTPKKKRGRESMVYKMTPQTINKNENPRGYRLGTVSAKTIYHWGFKPGSRVL
jgi:hypothetical protein